MCGIVGYVGEKQAANFLIDGLTKLEYRGYDSAGIAVFDGEKINVAKSVGRLAALKEKIKNNTPEGVMGIGHTRWATHGEPNKKKVAKLPRAEAMKIAESKMQDLNAADIEAATRMIEGTARSMGIEIVD